MRKEITLEEAIKRKQAGVGMDDIQVSGMVVIKDKDGNVKSELQIVSLETNQESEKNAT